MRRPTREEGSLIDRTSCNGASSVMTRQAVDQIIHATMETSQPRRGAASCRRAYREHDGRSCQWATRS